MAQPTKGDSRWPNPHGTVAGEQWEFPFGQQVESWIDGGGKWIYQKNGFNTIITQHGTSGSYEEWNSRGDHTQATTGNKYAYNRGHECETCEGNSHKKSDGHVASSTAMGSMHVTGGDMHTAAGGDTVHAGGGGMKVAVAGDSQHSAGKDGGHNYGGKLSIAAGTMSGGGTKYSLAVNGNKSEAMNGSATQTALGSISMHGKQGMTLIG